MSLHVSRNYPCQRNARGVKLSLFLQSDHEKHTQRSKEVQEAAQFSAHSGRDPALGASQQSHLNTDAARLYENRDLRLKEGETMKINLKRPGSAGISKFGQLPQNLPTVSLASPQQARNVQASSSYVLFI
jgi:hypothetical protein